MTDKVYSFIGLAKKAGKLVSGDENCTKTIKSGKALLVLVAENASENTAKKFNDACVYRKVPFYRFGKKEEFGRLLGKEVRSVIVITDNNFAKKLSELIMDWQYNKKNTGVS